MADIQLYPHSMNLSCVSYIANLSNLPITELVSAHGSLPIPTNNQGHRMLLQMGWSPGQGLGKNNQGMSAPIQAERRQRRSGLGT